MKLGYNVISWGTITADPYGVTSFGGLYYRTSSDLKKAMREMIKAGFTGIELMDGDVEPFFKETQRFKDLLQKYELKLIAVYSAANHIFPDARKEELTKIKNVAQFIKEAGGERLDTGGGAKRNDGIRNDDWKELVKGLDEVVMLCNDIGVTCCYHPHLGTITETKDPIYRVLEKTKMDFCPDPAHLMASGVDIIDVVKTFSSKITYVHLKDWDGERFIELGKGKVDLVGFTETLRSIGYDGWYTVEQDPPCENAYKSAKINMKYIKDNLMI